MFELFLFILVIVVMGRMAGIMNRSGLAWAGITFLICAGTLLLPLPFMRVFIAGALAFAVLFVTEMVRPRQN